MAGSKRTASEKIRILFLAANPMETRRLDLEEEVHEIERKLEAAQYRDCFELVPKLAVQADELQTNLLKYKPYIVHFTGHGNTRGEIVLRGRDGGAKAVGKKGLAGLFRTLKDNVRVVVLSACHTKKQAEGIAEVIDFVVGIRRTTTQAAAIAFAASFYEALGFGRSVQEAFDLGSNRLEIDGIGTKNAPTLVVRKGVDPGKVRFGGGEGGGTGFDARGDGVAAAAIGAGAVQEVRVDRSDRQSGGIRIEGVSEGAVVNLTVNNNYYYVDGLAGAKNVEVRGLFEKGRTLYAAGEYEEGIRVFERCLEVEGEHEKRGALRLQMGNCYCAMREYVRAGGCYEEGLGESKKAGDLEGEAANLGSIGNTYMQRPAATGGLRGENVRMAIDCYRAALEIYKKDEYPVEYAGTQNNLGIALRDLPSATAAERAKNVSAAIDCYRAALEIYKKDEYPQVYCQTAENLGLVLASVGDGEACGWLKEAYALREYLEDQGKRLEEVMPDVCKE